MSKKYECWIQGWWEIEADSEEEARRRLMEIVRWDLGKENLQVNCLDWEEGNEG